jgi:hypothetical protein
LTTRESDRNRLECQEGECDASDDGCKRLRCSDSRDTCHYRNRNDKGDQASQEALYEPGGASSYVLEPQPNDQLPWGAFKSPIEEHEIEEPCPHDDHREHGVWP